MRKCEVIYTIKSSVDVNYLAWNEINKTKIPNTKFSIMNNKILSSYYEFFSFLNNKNSKIEYLRIY